MIILAFLQCDFPYSISYVVPTSDDGNVVTFDRKRKQQGVWPFRCNRLLTCDNLRQQSCGCEEEGSGQEGAAIVHYFSEIGEPGTIKE